MFVTLTAAQSPLLEQVPLPNAADRGALIALFMRGIDVDEALPVRDIVRETAGWNGAEIRALCAAAAMAPLREAVPLLLQQRSSSSVAGLYAAPQVGEHHAAHDNGANMQHPQLQHDTSSASPTIRPVMIRDFVNGVGAAGRRAATWLGQSQRQQQEPQYYELNNPQLPGTPCSGSPSTVSGTVFHDLSTLIASGGDAAPLPHPDDGGGSNPVSVEAYVEAAAAADEVLQAQGHGTTHRYSSPGLRHSRPPCDEDAGTYNETCASTSCHCVKQSGGRYTDNSTDTLSATPPRGSGGSGLLPQAPFCGIRTTTESPEDNGRTSMAGDGMFEEAGSITYKGRALCFSETHAACAVVARDARSSTSRQCGVVSQALPRARTPVSHNATNGSSTSGYHHDRALSVAYARLSHALDEFVGRLRDGTIGDDDADRLGALLEYENAV